MCWEREDRYHIFAEIVVSEEKPVIFKQKAVERPTSDQIVVRNVIIGVPSHIEEATTNSVLDNLTD